MLRLRLNAQCCIIRTSSRGVPKRFERDGDLAGLVEQLPVTLAMLAVQRLERGPDVIFGSSGVQPQHFVKAWTRLCRTGHGSMLPNLDQEPPLAFTASTKGRFVKSENRF